LPVPGNPFIMILMSNPRSTSPRSAGRWNTALVIVTLLIVTAWLIFTPPGLDGKLHATGYSVCHQIDDHSFVMGGKVLPLCARCTGTFLGLLITLIYLHPRDKRNGFPSRAKIAILVLFFLFFAVDGINSSLTLLPGLKPLYPPSNLLRLISGLLMGIALANLVLALWNQTLWVEQDPSPIMHKWGQLGWLILLCAAAGALVIADVGILYYPIAILSTLSVFVILSMIYSLLWCIILKKENTMHLFRDGFRIFIMGIITAIVQVGVMDLLRYILSGTW